MEATDEEARKSCLKTPIHRDPLGGSPVRSPLPKSARVADGAMDVDASAAAAVLSGAGGSAAGVAAGGVVPGGAPSGSVAAAGVGGLGLSGGSGFAVPPAFPEEFCEVTQQDTPGQGLDWQTGKGGDGNGQGVFEDGGKGDGGPTGGHGQFGPYAYKSYSQYQPPLPGHPLSDLFSEIQGVN